MLRSPLTFHKKFLIKNTSQRIVILLKIYQVYPAVMVTNSQDITPLNKEDGIWRLSTEWTFNGWITNTKMFIRQIIFLIKLNSLIRRKFKHILLDWLSYPRTETLAIKPFHHNDFCLLIINNTSFCSVVRQRNRNSRLQLLPQRNKTFEQTLLAKS